MMDFRQIVSLVVETIKPLHRKVQAMVSRGIVKTIDNSKSTQTVQLNVYADETTFAVESLEPYGFSSFPLVGAQALQLRVGGSKAHSVVPIVSDARYRPTGLLSGEVCLHMQADVLLKLKSGNIVEIGLSPSQFAARADRVDAAIDELKTKFNAHTHVVTATVAAANGVIPAPVASAAPGTAASPGATACDKVKIV